MLKKILAAGTAVLTALAALTGCSFDPVVDEPDLYGPAPDSGYNENWDEESVTTLYGPPPASEENPAWSAEDDEPTPITE